MTSLVYCCLWDFINCKTKNETYTVSFSYGVLLNNISFFLLTCIILLMWLNQVWFFTLLVSLTIVVSDLLLSINRIFFSLFHQWYLTVLMATFLVGKYVPLFCLRVKTLFNYFLFWSWQYKRKGVYKNEWVNEIVVFIILLCSKTAADFFFTLIHFFSVFKSRQFRIPRNKH